MATNSYDSSESSPVVRSLINSAGTAVREEVAKEARRSNTLQSRLRENLEANKGKNGQINWLGSSYAGADIRVVAHTYVSGSELNQGNLNAVEEELAFYEELLRGATNLKSGSTLLDIGDNTTTFGERLDLFEIRSGIDKGTTAGQRALAQLRRDILQTTNFNSFVSISQAFQKLDALTLEATRRQVSLLKEIENIKEFESVGNATLNLGALQTISVQSFRDKAPVRALGNSYVKGYSRGSRTVAGSMVFTIFTEHPLTKILHYMSNIADGGIYQDPSYSTIIPDQLPPLDLTVVFANEYGALSRLSLYGVEFVSDGSTFSIDDLLSEQVMQFVARDVDVMTDEGKVRLSRLGRLGRDEKAASSLLGSEEYRQYLEKLKVRRRFLNR